MPSTPSPASSQWQRDIMRVVPLLMFLIALMGWSYTDQISGSLSYIHFGLGLLVLFALAFTKHFAGWCSGVEEGEKYRNKNILDSQERGAVKEDGLSSTPGIIDTIPTTTGCLGPPPPDHTIYPLQHGTPPPNDRQDIPIRHNEFMCIAVQSFTGNRALYERDLKIGELVSIIASKTGRWYAISHDTRGGTGWVPAIYLEKYNPATDPRVYYDESLPPNKANLYAYNPGAWLPLDENAVQRITSLFEPWIKVAGVSATLGLYEIGISNFEGADVKTLPKVFEG
ncbi:hypothetical protein IFR05_006016 [Cadophora sp. M221]|nr:hypothetical protein IFR05_006016 [Cadophora sp. M221]